MTLGEQAMAQVAADEASSAGYQNFGQYMPPTLVIIF
jgi:hypothetical protein